MRHKDAVGLRTSFVDVLRQGHTRETAKITDTEDKIQGGRFATTKPIHKAENMCLNWMESRYCGPNFEKSTRWFPWSARATRIPWAWFIVFEVKADVVSRSGNVKGGTPRVRGDTEKKYWSVQRSAAMWQEHATKVYCIDIQREQIARTSIYQKAP